MSAPDASSTEKAARIVSLVPSATEMVCALGAIDLVAGVSHERSLLAEDADRTSLSARSCNRLSSGTEVRTPSNRGMIRFPAGQSFRWIIGDFPVPAVFPKGTGSEFCSAWIGIDGDGSNDVCQFGIECDTTKAANGSVSNSYCAWPEWYPIAEVPIGNFPIAPGDDLTLLLCTSGVGATSASLYFTNRTSGASTSLQFRAHASSLPGSARAPDAGTTDATVDAP